MEDGPKTYSALFAYAGQRSADMTIAAIGGGGEVNQGRPDHADADAASRVRRANQQRNGGFTRFEGGLRYSALTMLAPWPTHFTAAQAAACVGRPVDIARRAYGGRMDNAVLPAKDGWLYRGRGMLQPTGKTAYARFGRMVGLALVGNPDLTTDPTDSLVIAREFWRAAGGNTAGNANDFTQARQLINGGSIGLANVGRSARACSASWLDRKVAPYSTLPTRTEAGAQVLTHR